MKICINSDFGGFSLSDEAFEEYLNIKGISYTKELNTYGGYHFYENGPDAKGDDADMLWDGNLDRDDTILIQVVEKLGAEKASGTYASLKIVEIPDDVKWEIGEYDGREWVAEKHRRWS